MSIQNGKKMKTKRIYNIPKVYRFHTGGLQLMQTSKPTTPPTDRPTVPQDAKKYWGLDESSGITPVGGSDPWHLHDENHKIWND